MVVTLMMSLLDYCNSLLVTAADKQIQRLQRLQNAGARIVMRPPRWAHMAPVLRDLHWLPVRDRCIHKTLSFVFKCRTEQAPTYLSDLLVTYNPSINLRSAERRLLCVPQTKLKSYGDRAFSVVGPRLWNQLPDSLRAAPSLAAFKTKLKTFLFCAAP